MSVLPVVARFALIIALLAAPLTAGAALTLADAERLALERAPWFQHHRTNVSAAAERVEYEGRLPDPQLTVGFVNVPTTSYNLRSEDMTMTNVGVRQQFPPGDTLALRTQRARQELSREEARLEMEKRNLLRQVRQTWFDLFFVNRALALAGESRTVQQRLLDDAEARYRAAAGAQAEALAARQALARLDDRIAMLRAQRARWQALLARWIQEAAFGDFPSALPAPAPLPDNFDHTRHPEWLASRAGLEAAQTDVALARQEYKPGFMVDVSWGLRRPNLDGAERADLFSALVTVDLPIFRAKRQDRRLAEKQAAEAAARYESEDKRRELEAGYRAARAEYDALAERVQIFAGRVVPAAEREASLTVAGFARDQALRREARLKALEAMLDLERLRVDLARSRAELLYLTGENNHE